jgi:transposase
MGQRRRRFTLEFKAETVRLCKHGDRSIGRVAQELDLAESAVRRWVKQDEIDHGPNPTGALTSQEHEELRILRRQVRVLREERRWRRGACRRDLGRGQSVVTVSVVTQAPPLWPKVCQRSLCTTRRRLFFGSDPPHHE